MAQLPSAFNSEEHDDMNSYTLIPKGTKVVAAIVESEYKQNSKKNGHFASLKWRINGGEHDGRYLFTNLNLDNPSNQAVEIAQKELATICRACGVVSVDDTDDLHNIDCTLEIGVQKASGDWPDRNKIDMYEQLEGAERPSKPSSGKASPKASESKAQPRRKPVFEDDDE